MSISFGHFSMSRLRRAGYGVSFLFALGLLSLMWGAAGCDALCALIGLPVDACNLAFNQPSGSLGVEVEVRFVAVEDDFFERIGIDFDTEIESEPAGAGVQPPTSQPADTTLLPSSQTGGAADTNLIIPRMLSSSALFLPTVQQNRTPDTINFFPGLPNPDFQIPTRGATALPNLNDLPGGLNLGTWPDSDHGGFGLAILSDIEISLFIQAAQADQNATILSAPKVTLFNGQHSLVVTQSESTLVTDLQEPFAGAVGGFDSQIQMVQSGPMLRVLPIISADRRFIRLSMAPIQAITVMPGQTFNVNGVNNSIVFPVFRVASVQTTVSVPDGGTILLGGIRRASDGGYERGVPVLNKLPYINRLFKNTALVRETQSLMLMVTPRIIIQEEEE